MVNRLIKFSLRLVQIFLIVAFGIFTYLSYTKVGVARHVLAKSYLYEDFLSSTRDSLFLKVVIGILLLSLVLTLILGLTKKIISSKKIREVFLALLLSLTLTLTLYQKIFVNLRTASYLLVFLLIILGIQVIFIFLPNKQS